MRFDRQARFGYGATPARSGQAPARFSSSLTVKFSGRDAGMPFGEPSVVARVGVRRSPAARHGLGENTPDQFS